MFGLLVKVVGSLAVDPGFIPGSSQLRHKSGIGHWTRNCKILKFIIDDFFKKLAVLTQF